MLYVYIMFSLRIIRFNQTFDKMLFVYKSKHIIECYIYIYDYTKLKSANAFETRT